MKYYCFGNIYIAIKTREIVREKSAKMEQFSLKSIDNMNGSIMTIYVNCVNELKMPTNRYDIKNGNCIIWISPNIRAYIEKNEIYAVFYPQSEQHYILEIQENFYHCITTERQLLNHLSLENIFLENNAFVLHSSFIKYQGNGLLFFAPSGTGKSTQADLWRQYAGAEIINGDRSLIRYESAKWTAYGLPFSGTSDYCKNDSAPIKGIIYLSQASENKLENLSPATAIRKLYSEITVNSWNAKFIEKIFSLLEILVKDIPVYSFACKKSETAVTYLKSQLFDNN